MRLANTSAKDRIMTPDIKRILVPLDFSANSARALDYAHGLARRFGAAIHLVNVCEVPTLRTGSTGAYAMAYAEWSRNFGEESELLLHKEMLALSDVAVTSEVLFGGAAAAIVDAAARSKSDLIVMGTHGYGPVMHLMMGNVAERVVRLAPCPVLTVREPRAPTAMKAAVANLTAVLGAFLMAIALPSVATAQEMKQVTTGSEVFKTYCASCHGTSARGDGRLATNMVKKPANLTEIAKRNGGSFPSEMVFRTIDGRTPVRGHGGPDMPVWGDAFSRSREAGDQDRVKAVIQSLVDYLDSIQLRPGQD